MGDQVAEITQLAVEAGRIAEMEALDVGKGAEITVLAVEIGVAKHGEMADLIQILPEENAHDTVVS